MHAAELVAACRELPLFPLPRVVLMPRSLLPLHVFEPRYRELVADVMAGNRLLGVATLVPGHEAEYYGCPPIHPEVGVGRVVSYRTLPDGRSNIVVHAVGRGRVSGELPARSSYRVFDVELVREPVPDSEALYAPLKALVVQVGSFSANASEEARRLQAMDGSDLLDELARKLLTETDERLAWLRMEREAERVHWVEERLAALLADRAAAEA